MCRGVRWSSVIYSLVEDIKYSALYMYNAILEKMKIMEYPSYNIPAYLFSFSPLFRYFYDRYLQQHGLKKWSFTQEAILKISLLSIYPQYSLTFIFFNEIGNG